MPLRLPRRRAAGSSRAILFCSGLLAAVLGTSYMHVLRAGGGKLGDRHSPPGWPMTFRIPDGWTERGESQDLFGGRQRTYADEFGLRSLSIRFLPILPGMTPETLCRWAVAEEWPVVPERLRAAQVEVFKVNDWPAAILQVWQRQTEEWTAFETQVIGIVPPPGQAAGFCYTVELGTRGRPVPGSAGLLKAIAHSIEEVRR